MNIFVFSSKKTSPLKPPEKNAAALRLLPIAALLKHRPEAEDLSCLDISGLPQGDLKKAINKLKKACAASPWGIIDPKGEAPDPAAFFFEGASDYIGPGLIKKGLDKKRLAAVLLWRNAGSGTPAVNAAGVSTAKKDAGRKLPGGKFEGWKSIRAGTTAPFFFLFVSLSEQASLRTRMGEAAFDVIKNRLRDILQQNLQDSQALLWMETESSSLFLIPPRAVYGKAAVEASLRMLAGCRLIGIEKLGLSIPVDFIFALHYGKTVFRAPGKTGAVVSDAVNYIFHLGTKHAGPGRLALSADVSDEVVPEGLADVFTAAGIFEGLPIRHSRRFICLK
ncbi:MAG: hypothetical protein LBK02_04685 [Treponema sp.]|jgi:hypothetical protein|nr:hypothetical protein [Treponema sp.]